MDGTSMALEQVRMNHNMWTAACRITQLVGACEGVRVTECRP